MKLLIVNPAIQHSHQLAWALEEQGMLAELWSGVPTSAAAATGVWRLSPLLNRVRFAEIPPNKNRLLLLPYLMLKIGQYIPRFVSDVETWNHQVFHAYDLLISRKIPACRFDGVIAPENCAYHTFAAAKRVGMKCILDASSYHHAMGTEMLRQRGKFRSEINRRKDKEIELADLILTCSNLAQESYVAAGIERSKVHSVPLGAQLRQVRTSAAEGGNAVPRFVFAGAPSFHKSIDVILAAFEMLADKGIPFELLFVGGPAKGEWQDKIRAKRYAKHRPSVPQEVLFSIFETADCLLLPSRFDSFGMVVAEAMACGTPAIVSTYVGAKSMIEEFPGSGWIISPDVGELYALVEKLILNRSVLQASRQVALRASAAYTWDIYRATIGELMRERLA